jgi:hypothetical protein
MDSNWLRGDLKLLEVPRFASAPQGQRRSGPVWPEQYGASQPMTA